MKQDEKQGLKNRIGAYGEIIAANYLKKKGFVIISQNYLKKWGEIDIAARGTKENKEIVCFVEVKTVSYETKTALSNTVFHETWRPEENVHEMKLKRMYRVIESWIMENNYEGEWQIDIAAVRVVSREKYATIKYIPNIIN